MTTRRASAGPEVAAASVAPAATSTVRRGRRPLFANADGWTRFGILSPVPSFFERIVAASSERLAVVFPEVAAVRGEAVEQPTGAGAAEV